MPLAILGTLDTKGEEHAFVARQVRERGHETLIIDVGTLGEPALKPDIARREIAIVDVAGLNRISRQRPGLERFN